MTEFSTSSTGLTVTHNGTVTSQTIAISELGGVNTGALLSFEGLTYNGTALVDANTNTITPYTTLYSYGEAFEDGKSYNVCGIYLQYNDTKGILPRSAADIEEVVVTTPTITVSTASVNVSASPVAPATYIEGTLPITYTNLTINDFDDFDIMMCDSNGDELSTPPSWIVVETAEDNGDYVVSYIIEENDGAARSAYFKVYAMDSGSNLVYSNLVTINQAAYVADYATLPFEEFTGGKSAIDETPGLSYTGLGNDYSTAAKLRFDTTDDNLVLKINGSPSAYTLQFNIKGNPSTGSWSGTFKLQTSADGVVYNDFKVYSTLSNSTSGQVEKLDGFADDVRYFKWVYTDQTNGNVGVGKISLTRPNAETSMVIPASFNGGKYWATFFNSAAAYSLPAGAKAYTLNSSKQLYLLGNGSVIPANTAVIIIADAESITLTKIADTSVTISGGTNILKGSNYGVTVGGIPVGAPYVLGIKTGVLNFYKFAGEAVPANKAYYIVNE